MSSSFTFYLRTSLNDNPQSPSRNATGNTCPDIICSGNTLTQNPQVYYVNDYDTDPNVAVVAGSNNYFYVRFWNTTSIAQNANVNLYYTPASLMMSPSTWLNNKILNYSGSTTTVVSGAAAQAASAVGIPFQWNVPPNPYPSVPSLNHYCLIGSVLADGETLPMPSQLNVWTDFLNWINGSSCLGFRNLMNITVPPTLPNFTSIYNYQNITSDTVPMVFTVQWYNLPVGTTATIMDKGANVSGTGSVKQGQTQGVWTAGGNIPPNYLGQIQVSVYLPTTAPLPSNFRMVVTANLLFNPNSAIKEVRDLSLREPDLVNFTSHPDSVELSRHLASQHVIEAASLLIATGTVTTASSPTVSIPTVSIPTA